MSESNPPPSAPVSAARGEAERGSSALLLKLAGVAVSVWGAVLVAVVGAFYTPFRVGTALAPVSLVVVIAGNAALVWFAYRVTGRRFLALLPGLVWLAVSFLWASRTTEGDLVLIQQNWVATAYLIVGAAAIAVTAYRMFLPARP